MTTLCSIPMSAASPVIVLLEQLAEALHSITDSNYTQKPIGPVESSIGGHVRHCLDHVSAFLAAIDSGLLNYDHRARGTVIETSRGDALAAIDNLGTRLAELFVDALEKPCTLRTMLCADQEPIVVETNLRRELAYVISHTIHHFALIAISLKLLNRPVPDRFGYAPSTVAYHSQCVR